MKNLFFLLMIFPVLLIAQRRKKVDVISNIEVKVTAMKPVGNNSLAQNLQPFYGFGFGGNLMTPINFGVGIDYTEYFSNTEYGRKNIYGSLGAPRITQIDAMITHRHELSEDLFTEAFGGVTYYRFANNFTAGRGEKHIENANGFLLGAKLIYTLNGPQQVFITAKGNYYSGKVYNENPEIQRYYSQSFLLSLAAGYRFQF